MVRFKQLPVKCQCGNPIAIYLKGGKGRLRKMYFGRIKEDLCGALKKDETGTDINCPECEKRIGTIAMVSGHLAIKINQGVVRE